MPGSHVTLQVAIRSCSASSHTTLQVAIGSCSAGSHAILQVAVRARGFDLRFAVPSKQTIWEAQKGQMLFLYSGRVKEKQASEEKTRLAARGTGNSRNC